MKEMFIGRDNCGNYAIKAYDRENGRFYGTKWRGAIRYIGYSKRDAIKAFRETFNLKHKRFTIYDCGQIC